jgi:predicted amidohydrolase
MIAAVVQMSSQDVVADNLARVKSLVADAASAGAELVVLPENFAFMGDEGTKRAIAESLSGPSHGPIAATLAELASKHAVDLVAGGMPEQSGEFDRPYNTSVLFGPTGDVVAKYRKIHLFDVQLADGTEHRESASTKAGRETVVADVGSAALGMSICYDVRFPELYRALVGKGAQLVAVPSAFTVTTGKDHWHVLLRARAIENQVFVLAAAQHGNHPRGRKTYGKSLVVDPWGDVVAQCGEGEGFAVARIDLRYQERVRAELPCLTHRSSAPTNLN